MINDVSDQWFLPTDVQYVNRQIAYAWHPASAYMSGCAHMWARVESWALRRQTTRSEWIFATYTLLPLLSRTDHLFTCVCICHELLKRLSGDASLNIFIICRAQSLTCTCKVLHIHQRKLSCKEWCYGSSSKSGKSFDLRVTMILALVTERFVL